MSLIQSLSRGLLGLGLMLLTVFLIAAFVALFWAQFETLNTIEQRLEAASPWLTALRITLITVTVAAWPHLVTWFVTDPAKREALLRARWRLAGWLVILEITLGQGLVAAFIASLVSLGA
jgi:hypothetical protein